MLRLRSSGDRKFGVTRLMRSSSESDLTKLKEGQEEKKMARKKWNKAPSPRYLVDAQLETTASQMEG